MDHLFQNYWWAGLILLALIFYKFVLRFFFGMVIVPEDKVGLVTKKFVLFGENKELPDGRIIATLGEAGFQAKLDEIKGYYVARITTFPEVEVFKIDVERVRKWHKNKELGPSTKISKAKMEELLKTIA